jgi:hypothetical protein
MTKHEQREIWQFKLKHEELAKIPDAVLYVIFKRAKDSAVRALVRKRA